MKTLSSTPDLIARYSLLGSFAEHDFALRPTFQGVIAQLFKSLLQDQYPNLDTGSAVLWIAEPLANQPRGFRFMALADVLMQSYIDATPVSLIKGFHRLTTDLTVLDPQPLPVDLSRCKNWSMTARRWWLMSISRRWHSSGAKPIPCPSARFNGCRRSCRWGCT